MHDSPSQRTALALLAWERNARSALHWAHASWIAKALGIDENAAAALAGAVPGDLLEASSLALLDSARLPLPELDALAQVHVARLDAMPPDIGLQVLRLRALRFRSGEIRRIVDKTTRQRVLQWAGVPLNRLTQMQSESAPDIARLAIPPLDTLDDTALALEGHALIKRDTHDSNHSNGARSPCALLTLALPRAQPGARHWAERAPPEMDPDGTHALIKALPELFPEWAWLFG